MNKFMSSFIILYFCIYESLAIDVNNYVRYQYESYRFAPLGPILGGVDAGIGYTIGNGIANSGFDNFSWGALGTAITTGAIGGIAAGFLLQQLFGDLM